MTNTLCIPFLPWHVQFQASLALVNDVFLRPVLYPLSSSLDFDSLMLCLKRASVAEDLSMPAALLLYNPLLPSPGRSVSLQLSLRILLYLFISTCGLVRPHQEKRLGADLRARPSSTLQELKSCPRISRPKAMVRDFRWWASQTVHIRLVTH